MGAVQAAVNQVAERTLVGRRIFEAIPTTAALLVSFGWERPAPAEGQPDADLKTYLAKTRGTPTMLWTDLVVDPAELAEAHADRAQLPDLAKKVRELAAAEDLTVFKTVSDKAAETSRVSARTEDDLHRGALEAIFSATTRMRQHGHLGELALVATVVSVPDPDDTKPPHVVDLLTRLAQAGSLRAVQQFFSAGVFAAKLPDGLAALVVAPGSADVRIMVAQNYEVTWLGVDLAVGPADQPADQPRVRYGPHLRFGVSVSLSVYVGDGTALQRVELALTPAS